MITVAEVQQIRQNAIYHGPITQDQIKRLAQTWLDQRKELDRDTRDTQ